MLSVLIRSPDRRIITPAEIDADKGGANAGLPGFTERAALSDDVSDKLVALYGSREPWRQTYAEQTTDSEGTRLRPTRYPIENDPEVWLGSTALTKGLYRVDGQSRCRHELRRDPNIAYAAASSGLPLATQINPSLVPLGSSNLADFRIPSYVAGYVPPGSINAAWKLSTDYSPGESISYGDDAGSWVRPRFSALLFECTTAGTSDTSEPAWPESLAEWAPNFSYSSLQWLAPPSSILVFEPTTPGTSGTEEPIWPTAAGDTVSGIGGTAEWTARTAMDITDGTVVWTGRNAKEFPRGIRKAALLMARILRSIDQDGSCEDHEKKMSAVMHLLEGSC